MPSLKARIARIASKAVKGYGMIEAGDVIAVAVSGGKDSLTLLDVLINMRRRAPFRFDLVAVTIDQGFEGFRWPEMERYFESRGVPYLIRNTRISDVMEDKREPGSTWCSLCARLRRGVLYKLAREKGWSKIALGHHADDLIETLLLSQFFNGCLQSMPPILKANDGHSTVIRPLSFVWEREIRAYAKERKFPVICCSCPACGDLTLKRRRVKELLRELEASWPGIKGSLLSAQGNIRVTQLMDPRFLPLGKDASLRDAAAPRDGRLAPGKQDWVPELGEAGPESPAPDLPEPVDASLPPLHHGAACTAECTCGPLLQGP